jgi:hypothetical protein
MNQNKLHLASWNSGILLYLQKELKALAIQRMREWYEYGLSVP